MTSQDEYLSLYYRSPRDIRNESFTHRMRGLDESEVREYLDLVADQIEGIEWERRELLAELERLRAGAEQVIDPTTPGQAPQTTPEGGNDQAAAVLLHAQQVADQLLDDARRRAQEIIEAAQSRGHQVVRQARVTTLERMQALYDELDGELSRMGEAIGPPEPGPTSPAQPRHDTGSPA